MNTEKLGYKDALRKAVEFEAEKNSLVQHMIRVLKDCGFGRKFIITTVKKDLKGIVRPSLVVYFANQILGETGQKQGS